MVLLLCVATLNILVDPYALFGTPRITGFNALKPDTSRHGELSKTYEVERVRPRTVLLGASRVDVGLDPASSVWPASMKPVFNYGIDGAGLRTLYNTLREAAATGRLTNAVVMLDFELFWVPETPSPAPTEGERRYLLAPTGNTNPDRFFQRLQDAFLATLSLSALTDSFDTILQQHMALTPDLTPLGFSTDGRFQRAVRIGGYGSLFSQKKPLIVDRARQAAAALARRHGDLPNMNKLQQIIAFCRSHNIALTLVIPPFHSALLDIFRQNGLWNQFDAYKVQLAAALPGGPGSPVTLWDFSGYNRYTMDKVPALNDRNTIPQWYWEYDHFKAALGEKMLERILGDGPQDFGIRLSPESVSQAMPPKLR